MNESNACADVHLLGRETACVQLQDAWSNFCRDVIFRSWRGGLHTLEGKFIARRPGEISLSAALTELRSTYTGRAKKARHWEPRWFDPVEAIEAASRLAIPNLPDVSGGIGLSPSPLAELRAVRNFFAHRGERSVSKLSAWVPHPATDAVHQHVSAMTGGGALRFERWVAQLDLMARVTVR